MTIPGGAAAAGSGNGPPHEKHEDQGQEGYHNVTAEGAGTLRRDRRTATSGLGTWRGPAGVTI